VASDANNIILDAKQIEATEGRQWAGSPDKELLILSLDKEKQPGKTKSLTQ